MLELLTENTASLSLSGYHASLTLPENIPWLCRVSLKCIPKTTSYLSTKNNLILVYQKQPHTCLRKTTSGGLHLLLLILAAGLVPTRLILVEVEDEGSMWLFVSHYDEEVGCAGVESCIDARVGWVGCAALVIIIDIPALTHGQTMKHESNMYLYSQGPYQEAGICSRHIKGIMWMCMHPSYNVALYAWGDISLTYSHVCAYIPTYHACTCVPAYHVCAYIPTYHVCACIPTYHVPCGMCMRTHIPCMSMRTHIPWVDVGQVSGESKESVKGGSAGGGCHIHVCCGGEGVEHLRTGGDLHGLIGQALINHLYMCNVINVHKYKYMDKVDDNYDTHHCTQV